MNQESNKRRARELHEQAIVIDGHSDILIPITEGKMRLGDKMPRPVWNYLVTEPAGGVGPEWRRPGDNLGSPRRPGRCCVRL